MAEEVGLEVESLWYSASQHWPFPSSCLLIACHAMVRAHQAEVSRLGFPWGISLPSLCSKISFSPQMFSLESIRSSLNAVFYWLSLQVKKKLQNNRIFCCNVPDFAQVTVYIQAQSPTPLYFFPLNFAEELLSGINIILATEHADSAMLITVLSHWYFAGQCLICDFPKETKTTKHWWIVMSLPVLASALNSGMDKALWAF